MSSISSHRSRILAIVPHSKGLGYAVFEGIKRPIDWGVKRVTGDKNQATFQKVEALIETYQPDAIVLEEVAGSRRSLRIKELLVAIAEHCRALGIEVTTYSRGAVATCLAADVVMTKYEIACRVAATFPALRPRLPEPRRPWQSEDYRMSIFEACGLCLAWFSNNSAPPPAG